jgi:uncharacterized membrane protein
MDVHVTAQSLKTAWSSMNLRLRWPLPGAAVAAAGRGLAARLRAWDGFAVPGRACIAHLLGAAFCLYGLVAVMLLATLLPPFQNPDEVAQFRRAASVADGHFGLFRFIETQPDGSERVVAGAASDPAIVGAFLPFRSLPFRPDHRADRTMWAPEVHWTRVRVPQTFTAQAMYPPFFYLPAAAAVLAGRMTRMTVVQTLVLGRVLTGLSAVTIGAAAIALCDTAAPMLFGILTLPMAFSLMASSAQDGVMLGASALAGALMLRAHRGIARRPRWTCLLLAIALGLVAMARPPYLGLAVVMATLPSWPRGWRVWSVLGVGGAVAAWVGVTAMLTAANVGAVVGADPAAQLAYLGAHPRALPAIALRTLAEHGREYLDQFIGQLGWLDTDLPETYRVCAWLVLGLALGAAMLGPRRVTPGRAGPPWAGLALVAGLSLCLIGIFGLQYLTWTVPGHDTVGGVQGRYFLPPALVAAGMVPAFGRSGLRGLRVGMVLAVALFPVVSIAVVIQTVVARYYLV